MKFKRRMVASSHDSMQTYFDMESEAAWVSFLASDYSKDKAKTPLFNQKYEMATTKLKRDLAAVGVNVTDDRIELDIPTKPNDKICTVVFFFKEGEMPNKEQLETVAKEVDIPSVDKEEDHWNKEDAEDER